MVYMLNRAQCVTCHNWYIGSKAMSITRQSDENVIGVRPASTDDPDDEENTLFTPGFLAASDMQFSKTYEVCFRSAYATKYAAMQTAQCIREAKC